MNSCISEENMKLTVQTNDVLRFLSTPLLSKIPLSELLAEQKREVYIKPAMDTIITQF